MSFLFLKEGPRMLGSKGINDLCTLRAFSHALITWFLKLSFLSSQIPKYLMEGEGLIRQSRTRQEAFFHLPPPPRKQASVLSGSRLNFLGDISSLISREITWVLWRSSNGDSASMMTERSSAYPIFSHFIVCSCHFTM